MLAGWLVLYKINGNKNDRCRRYPVSPHEREDLYIIVHIRIYVCILMPNNVRTVHLVHQ